ncbi:MAG: two-component regulator propeller domain-containing protein [Candidatus Aminicenantes bacterium]
MNSDVVTAIYQDPRDPQGILWIGTAGGGLNKFDRKKNQFTHYLARPGDANSLGSNMIFIISGSRTGVLWIGTVGEGVDKFDAKTERFTHYKHHPNQPDSFYNNNITDIYEEP